MATTLKDGKLYICATAQAAPLNQAGFEALSWVEVGHVGSIGQTGTQTNLPTYDELGTSVTQKQKGISNAGDTPIETARVYGDAGQILMRAAGLTKLNWAFKIEHADAPSAGFTNTITYNRGVVVGPTRPGGRNENFDLENYMLGLNDPEVVVDPVAGSVPVNSVLPAISNLAVLGNVLTTYEGVWSNFPTSYLYRWQRDTAGNGTWADISGQTARTHTVVAADQTNRVRVGVRGVNGAGTGSEAFSAPTIIAT